MTTSTRSEPSAFDGVTDALLQDERHGHFAGHGPNVTILIDRRRPAVSVAELKRAYQAVQAGQFRVVTNPGSAPESTGTYAESARSWSPDEDVVVVVGCAGSAGASTIALALATVAGHGRVVECCSATASGLAGASTAELGRHESGWLQGSRDHVLIERAATALSGPAEVPAPSPPMRHVSLSVMDIGWELGQAMASKSWMTGQLNGGSPIVAVAPATVPGLRRLEGVLLQLGHAKVVAAVVGPRRRTWPRGVEQSMGPLTRGLDRDGRLVAIPEDKDLAVRGVDTTPLPPALLSAAEQVLRLTRVELAGKQGAS